MMQPLIYLARFSVQYAAYFSYLRLYGCGESTRRLTGLMLFFPGLRFAFSSGETGRLDGRTISSTSLCGEFETKIGGLTIMEKGHG